MKLWVDDVRPAPEGYIWCKSVNETIKEICAEEEYYKVMWFEGNPIELIDLDHDAGDFAGDGGDYIRVLDWLEQAGIVDTGYFFHLHTQNPVGRENMERIIRKNGWRLVK